MGDVKIAPFSYEREPLAGYVCGECGARGVKLWREYQAFVITLRCADCAAKSQKIAERVDADGMIVGLGGIRRDQIGWCVPAVPTEDGTQFHGYMSVPEAGVRWWKSLPTRRTQ